MPFWQRLAITFLAMLAASFILGVFWRSIFNVPLPGYLAGVIGGLIAFGVIGLFIGPVLLAVCYTLMKAWVEEGNSGEHLEPAAFED